MLAPLGQRVSRHQCSSNPRISQRHARFILHRSHSPAGANVRATVQDGRMIIQGHTLTSPQGWEAMKAALRAANVKLVNPQEVVFMQQRGTPVVDIRPPADYDQGHIPGAVNVPFYQPITGWTPYKVARRVGYALFGVLQGTEVNPDFGEEVAGLLQQCGASSVVLYCSQGGSLEPVESSKRGRQSRSLVAAYDCVTREVASEVVVMKGGYNEWLSSGRDIEVMELVE